MEAIAHAPAAAANTRIEIRFIGRFIGPPFHKDESRCLTRRIVNIRPACPQQETIYNRAGNVNSQDAILLRLDEDRGLILRGLSVFLIAECCD